MRVWFCTFIYLFWRVKANAHINGLGITSHPNIGYKSFSHISSQHQVYWCNNTILLAHDILYTEDWSCRSWVNFWKYMDGFSKFNPWTSAVSLTHSWCGLTMWNLLIQSRMWCREWWVFRLFVVRNVTCWKWILPVYPTVLNRRLIKFKPSENDTEVISKWIELDNSIYTLL